MGTERNSGREGSKEEPPIPVPKRGTIPGLSVVLPGIQPGRSWEQGEEGKNPRPKRTLASHYQFSRIDLCPWHWENQI